MSIQPSWCQQRARHATRTFSSQSAVRVIADKWTGINTSNKLAFRTPFLSKVKLPFAVVACMRLHCCCALPSVGLSICPCLWLLAFAHTFANMAVQPGNQLLVTKPSQALFVTGLLLPHNTPPFAFFFSGCTCCMWHFTSSLLHWPTMHDKLSVVSNITM